MGIHRTIEFDTLVHFSTIESAVGAGVIDWKATVQTNSDEEISDHSGGPADALL